MPTPVLDPWGHAAGSPTPTPPTPLATPAPGSFLAYCIDYDGLTLSGNDATGAVGYATSTGVPATDRDSALALARVTAFKTGEQVGIVCPRFGNDATLMILIRSRNNRAVNRNKANTADQGMDFLNNLTGYRRILVRATNDFINDTNDKIVCGFQTCATGFAANGGGYSAGATTTTFTLANVLTASGAAPAFPAESLGSSAISGKRIRFRNTTPTAALRNATSMVNKNDATSILLSDVLPAVPIYVSPGHASNDLFDIEENGCFFGSFAHSLGGVVGAGLNAAQVKFCSIAGIGSASGSSSYVALDGEVSWSGIETLNTGAFSPNVTNFRRLDVIRTYVDELGSSVAVGVGIRSAGNVYLSSGNVCFFRSSTTLGPSGNLMFNVDEFAVGQGSLFRCGIAHDGGGGGPGRAEGGLTVTPLVLIGRFGSVASIASELRITADRTAGDAGIRGAIDLRASASATIQGVDFANITRPCIKINTLGGHVAVDGLTSTDGGNTDVVVDVSQAQGTDVHYEDIDDIAATATLGDIRLSGGAAASFDNLDFINYVDNGGNNITGNAGVTSGVATAVIHAITPIGAFNVVRLTGTNTVALAASGVSNHDPIAVTIVSAAAGLPGLVLQTGACPVLFTGTPVVGNVAYLSATPGQAQSTPTGLNDRKLGRIIADLGSNIGKVLLNIDV